MLEKLRIKITLIATLIVTAYAYLHNNNFLKTCYIIIITIVIFYLLGGFVEIFLKNKIEELKMEKEDEENNDQEDIGIYIQDQEEDIDYLENQEENENII